MNFSIWKGVGALLYVLIVFLEVIESAPFRGTFKGCLSSTRATISYPSNETWWYDSQGVFMTTVLCDPVAVTYPTSTSQVAKLINCAVTFQVKPVPRSGGHSYEAFSCGRGGKLVIDISQLNAVKIDGLSGTTIVGAGTRLGKLYYELSKNRLIFPAGDGMTVGLGGHVGSGGLGYVMRQYGTAADNVLEIEFVDWRGRILTLNEHNHAELFWALRGAGSGNFGIVTRMKLNVHPCPELSTGFRVTWKEPIKTSLFGQLLFKWKPWISMPDAMSISIVLYGNNRPAMSGIYLGSDGKEGLLKILNESGLVDVAGGAQLDHYSSKDYFDIQVWFVSGRRFPNGDLRDYLKRFNTAAYVLAPLNLPPFPNPVFEAWIPIQNDSRVNSTPPADDIRCIGPIPEVKPARMPHVYSKYSSQMFVKEFDDVAYAAIDRYLERGDMMLWKPHGGFLKNVSESKIAFPHRNAFFDSQYFTENSIPGAERPRTFQEKQEYYQTLIKALEPFTNHHSYQGYPDLLWGQKPDRAYLSRYYGKNVDRLIAVKRIYDPHDFFSNEQSIPLS